MYKQFCKNLNHFIDIIKSGDGNPNARFKIAEAILPLADVNSYIEYKKIGNPKYSEN